MKRVKFICKTCEREIPVREEIYNKAYKATISCYEYEDDNKFKQ